MTCQFVVVRIQFLQVIDKLEEGLKELKRLEKPPDLSKQFKIDFGGV